MECSACGPGRDYDVLYNCTGCQLSYCGHHVGRHSCTGVAQQPTAQSYNPMGRYTLDLSQLRQFFHTQQRREPTKQEYEMYLRSNPRVLTSGRESLDLIGGVLLIAFVFGFQPILQGIQTWQYIVMLTLVISPAFILHEFGHKYMAIYYGKYARFTMVRQMTYLSIFFGFMGFPLAAPGVTMVLGQSDDDESGKFAAAGPAINFLIAILAFGLTFIVPATFFGSIDQDLHWVLMFAMAINAYLGLFNLLPFGMFDGKKIINWNRVVWIGLIALNLMALLTAYPTLQGSI
ncbi:MAG: hypothetical protein ACXAB7_18990 [Candidatus Kariarchaeaceae archaeon]